MTLNVVDKTAMIITIAITGSIFYVTHNPLVDMFLRVNTKHLIITVVYLFYHSRTGHLGFILLKDDQCGEDVMT